MTMNSGLEGGGIEQEMPPHPATRATEIARLELIKLSIESGVTLEAIIRRACELAADVLQVARVGVWMFIDMRQSLRCVQLYEREKQKWSDGVLLQVADFPDYFATLDHRKIVPAEHAQTDPKTSQLNEAYLTPLGITSMLDAPIYVAGEVIGVFCSEHIGKAREWTTEERDFCASIADLLAIKFRAAEVLQLQATLRTSEAKMFAMEKSEALAKMALGVAHDFRNFLTTINNCTHVLETADSLSESLAESVKLIKTAAENGCRLVSELIDYGRSQPRHPYPLNLKKVIEAFLPILTTAVGKQATLIVDTSETYGLVFMDCNQFQRVLLNLVINARDASPEGGCIKIHTYDDKQQNSVTLEVRDEGSGMSEAVKQRVFEPFFTTKENGSGLGLPIVQRIVERAGGTIDIESVVGKGTAIRVHFPRVSWSAGVQALACPENTEEGA